MSHRRLIGARIIATTAILAAAATGTAVLGTAVFGTAAFAASGDTTPPTAPYILYASGLRWTADCLPLTIGVMRSTDNVTPQSALTYEVFADGVSLGALTDRGTDSGVWGVLHFKKAGPNTVTVKAVDAAGNRSASSNADVVTAYAC
jgi:hypothetical protein